MGRELDLYESNICARSVLMILVRIYHSGGARLLDSQDGLKERSRVDSKIEVEFDKLVRFLEYVERLEESNTPSFLIDGVMLSLLQRLVSMWGGNTPTMTYKRMFNTSDELYAILRRMREEEMQAMSRTSDVEDVLNDPTYGGGI